MTLEKIQIEYIPIQEILPYKNNPRKNDNAVEIVAKSIKEFGFKNPIILDKNNEIVAGHTRLKAAQSLGMQEVPVIWADDLTEEQVKAFRIMDNKSIEFAQWDEDLLSEEFHALEDTDYFDKTGFSTSEISQIWDKTLDSKEDDFDIPKEPKYKIEVGEVWTLGEHRLMCGDSTSEINIVNLTDDKTINMVLTDPPYNVDYSSKNDFLNKADKGCCNQTPIKNDKIDNFKEFSKNWLSLIPFAEENTVYTFISGKEIHNLILAFEEAGLYYSQDLKWVKNNHVLGRLDYNPKSENIIYGWKGKHKFYGGFQTDVLNYNKPNRSVEHPTMKPVELLSELLKHGSVENSIVYDPFGGSGSTLIACEQLNRKCYMMELDEFYCSVIIERWEKLTGKKAEKEV